MTNSWTNNRHPDAAELAALHNDPRAVRWTSLCDLYPQVTGEALHPDMRHIGQVRRWWQKANLVADVIGADGKKLRGWYRWTDAGMAMVKAHGDPDNEVLRLLRALDRKLDAVNERLAAC